MIDYEKIINNLIYILQKYEYEEDGIVHSREEWLGLLQKDLKKEEGN